MRDVIVGAACPDGQDGERAIHESPLRRWLWIWRDGWGFRGGMRVQDMTVMTNNDDRPDAVGAVREPPRGDGLEAAQMAGRLRPAQDCE